YGSSFFNIATDFGTGEYLAFSEEWKIETFNHDIILESTLTHCLKAMGSPNTFINLREARKDKRLMEFLNQPLTTMSGAGAQVRMYQTETQEIGKAFDGIIYLDKTSSITWAN